MGKKVIAVDIDEVLFPFIDEFLNHHNGRYGTDHKSAHFSSYEFEETLGISFEDTVDRVYEFNAMDCLHVEPIKDSVAAIKALGSKYDLEIITARNPAHKRPIENWIENHYGNSFGGIEFVGHPEAFDKHRPKVQVCRELKAIALIDDSLAHVRLCVDSGIEGILFGDYPWNTSSRLPRGVTRLADWRAVRKHFDA